MGRKKIKLSLKKLFAYSEENNYIIENIFHNKKNVILIDCRTPKEYKPLLIYVPSNYNLVLPKNFQEDFPDILFYGIFQNHHVIPPTKILDFISDIKGGELEFNIASISNSGIFLFHQGDKIKSYSFEPLEEEKITEESITIDIGSDNELSENNNNENYEIKKIKGKLDKLEDEDIMSDIEDIQENNERTEFKFIEDTIIFASDEENEDTKIFVSDEENEDFDDIIFEEDGEIEDEDFSFEDKIEDGKFQDGDFEIEDENNFANTDIGIVYIFINIDKFFWNDNDMEKILIEKYNNFHENEIQDRNERIDRISEVLDKLKKKTRERLEEHNKKEKELIEEKNKTSLLLAEIFSLSERTKKIELRKKKQTLGCIEINEDLKNMKINAQTTFRELNYEISNLKQEVLDLLVNFETGLSELLNI